MIVNFRDKNTAAFHQGERVAAFAGFERTAERKLDQLDAATSVLDLSRPGNHLEKLKRDREGQWSIRINDQWRICFEWPKSAAGPENVEIVDYH
jgi:proteic killer suppression protein